MTSPASPKTDELVEKIARALNPEAFAGYGHAGPQRDYWEFQRKKACDRARACLEAIEAAGLVIVPREPTKEMKDAGHYAGWHCGESDRVTTVVSAAWPAMLAAAPKQG